MSSQTSPVVLAQQFWEVVFNDGDFDAVAKFVGPAYTFCGVHQTPEQVVAFAKGLREKYDGLHFTIDEIFGDGESVALRWTLHGMDVISRQPVTDTAINLIRFIDGEALSNWQSPNPLAQHK